MWREHEADGDRGEGGEGQDPRQPQPGAQLCHGLFPAVALGMMGEDPMG